MYKKREVINYGVEVQENEKIKVRKTDRTIQIITQSVSLRKQTYKRIKYERTISAGSYTMNSGKIPTLNSSLLQNASSNELRRNVGPDKLSYILQYLFVPQLYVIPQLIKFLPS